MKKTRIELTFSSGKFIAFPEVDKKTIRVDEKEIYFVHGSRKDAVRAFVEKLDFLEIMSIED